MINKANIEGFETEVIDVDFCVVGGGISGMLAAISAARHGTRVALMQDRPVLGGNASSEVRMWIRGANGENVRETGILEEIALENSYRNPHFNFSIWDSVLLGKVFDEENIRLILNCSCLDAEMKDNKILSVTGWQTTTQKFVRVKAKIFADCSGDSILAPLTGAEWRMGRESSKEFSEDIAPEVSDNKTMGMSCLIQCRERNHPVKFIAPKWAKKFKKEDFINKLNFNNSENWMNDNFWWMELGGLVDSIHDTEKLRDELVKTAYGVWDFYKNSGEVKNTENWDIEWIGYLPGKRESRRYVGDILLNQNDVRSGGHFDDIIAYGGWTMDDHNPKGFLSNEPPTTFHPAPSPYGIPFRVLYSKNIENLTFAGRNISVTHTAMSSTRVMATCGILGQALGTAVSIAIRDDITPREIYEKRIKELQQTLIIDDCYLPFTKRERTPLMESVKLDSVGDVSNLSDGLMRVIDGEDHAFECNLGEKITLTLDKTQAVHELRIIFDSDINRVTLRELSTNERRYPMRCNIHLNSPTIRMPETLIRDFDILLDGKLYTTVTDNIKRLAIIPIEKTFKTLTVVPKTTWGAKTARFYHIELL